MRWMKIEPFIQSKVSQKEKTTIQYINTYIWDTERQQWWPYIQFSRSFMSNSLWTHEPQRARPPCTSPTPRVYPNSCPLSQWCHRTISSSVVPFSSCPQSFPGSFQISQLFASGGQSIGVSASTSVFPMKTQDWSPLGWTGWISLQCKGLWGDKSGKGGMICVKVMHQSFSAQLSS